MDSDDLKPEAKPKEIIIITIEKIKSKEKICDFFLFLIKLIGTTLAIYNNII